MERQDLNQCPSIAEMITSSWWLFLIPTWTLKKSRVQKRKDRKKEEIWWNQSVIEMKPVLFSLPGSFKTPGHNYIGFGGGAISFPFFLIIEKCKG